MPKANSDKDDTLSILKKLASKTKGGPLFAGIAFTALNPFFITWWLTVGLKLISDSVSLFVSHMDGLCMVVIYSISSF
jgi:threonine/homoserine/homoserine lactone efflux protein